VLLDLFPRRRAFASSRAHGTWKIGCGAGTLDKVWRRNRSRQVKVELAVRLPANLIQHRGMPARLGRPFDQMAEEWHWISTTRSRSNVLRQGCLPGPHRVWGRRCCRQTPRRQRLQTLDNPVRQDQVACAYVTSLLPASTKSHAALQSGVAVAIER
jgi:hypothetical protein